MKDIVFISDFFSHQVLGGGELNDKELIDMLTERGYIVKAVNSSNVSEDFIENNKNSFFIISNFVLLNRKCLDSIVNYCRYIIYEHDHKYVRNRNPGVYKDFIAPKDQIVNLQFYKNAVAVMLQSKLHEKIVYKNTNLENLVNLGGNLWSTTHLDIIEDLCDKPKTNTYAILDSSVPHKNTFDAVTFCKVKKYEYNLIKSSKYQDFLSLLGSNKCLVFIPKTPETLSRLVVESRMMNMSVITNNMVGATSEKWYQTKGKELIQVMRLKREEIVNNVIRFI